MKQGRVEIITPEGVSLPFQTAGIGSRFLAFSLDYLIIIASVAVLAIAINSLEPGLNNSGINFGSAILILYYFFIQLLYFLFFEITMGAQTPGKKIIGLRVLQTNGAMPTKTAIIMRNILRIIDMLPGSYFLGFLFIFFHPQERRIGDLVAGTMVVFEKNVKVAKRSDNSQASKNYSTLQLTPEEMQVLHDFFLREQELTRAKREELLKRYLEYFELKYGIVKEADTQARDFLQSLLHT